MELESLHKFEEKGWTDNADFEVEFRDGALAETVFSIDGAFTGGAGTVAQDAALKLLGQLELNQNGPRIKADARLLYYLSSVYEGGVRELAAGSGAASSFRARFPLRFQRMVPNGGLDATQKIVSWRGRFRSGSYYLSGGSTIGTATRARPTAIVPERRPAGGFREPEWIQETVKCESASVSANVRKIEARSSFLLPGLLLMALDADGDTAGLSDLTQRDDGVAHRVTVELFAAGQPRRVIYDDVTWGTLRANTAALARWTDADVTATAGIVWLPLFDRDPATPGQALAMPKDSHLTVTIDNASGAESGYTAVTPATGDRVEILAPFFHYSPNVAQAAAPTIASASRARGRRR